MENTSTLSCIKCDEKYPISRHKYVCDRCGGLLEVENTFSGSFTDEKYTGVWRYKPMLHPTLDDSYIVSRREGDTNLYQHSRVSQWTGANDLQMKHEGENPTGSFKDRGMTVAVSEAKRLGMLETICASTGNTSASAASYSALAGIRSSVLIPEGQISLSKLSQAISYGAKIVDVNGDFDDALASVIKLLENNQEYYVLNSVNPWRIEGQKTITFEIMESVGDCDFISLPAGNLGNTTAVGKALKELKSLDLIDRIPRIISVQAEGASPFYDLWNGNRENLVPVKAKTVASAIRIGNPVNWEKALSAINFTNGIVTKVSDEEIIESKRVVDKSGIGCEPASAASVAGVKKLVEEGTIDSGDRVVSILTGHILKDENFSEHLVRREGLSLFLREIEMKNAPPVY